ncbi:MAG: thioredoxin family protein [Chloroflexota bacterium]
MRVELLYSDDDPHYMTARQRLVEVLTEDAFETTIQMIAVNSIEDAELLAFPGSPTIRIDGIDIHPAGAAATRLGARAYPPDDDQDGPATESAPGKRLIRVAVERARGWGHGRQA